MNVRKTVINSLLAVLVLLGIVIIVWYSLGPEKTRLEKKEIPPSFQGEKICGEPIPWEKARLLFPRYTMAVVIDVETGKRFEVERRAGDYHADVQPLTAADTKVLQELYPSGWSWRRRAVVVEIGNLRLAASMHGMPHGASKIRGNDVRGHFCIHFLNSKVHASGKIDPAHQLMVWKAAGRSQEPFITAAPDQLIRLTFTALEQNDPPLAAQGVDPLAGGDYWLIQQNILGRLPAVSLLQIAAKKGEVSEDRKIFQVEIKLTPPGQNGYKKTGVLAVRKDPGSGRWYVEGSGLMKLLDYIH